MQLAGTLVLCVPLIFAQPTPQGPQAEKSSSPANVAAPASAPQIGEKLSLLSTRRICVATLGGDEKFAEQVRDMLISGLFASKRIVVTENCSRADAVLKGTATLTSERTSRLESEGVGFGREAAAVHSSDGSVSAGVAGEHGSSGETLASSTLKNLSNLAIRLVSHDGDVIWATTQESTGNKMKGPAADVADRAVRQLIRDIEKAEAPPKPKV